MSDWDVGITAGNLPPSVATQYTADDSTIAVPVANNLNTFTLAPSVINNTHGIQSHNSGSTVGYQLTNLIQGSGTTIDATPTVISTFPFSTNTGPGTYIFNFNTVAYNITDDLSAGYQDSFSVRFGVDTNGHLVNPQDTNVFEEIGMVGCDAALVVSGGNLLVRVTGLAGKTIDWRTSGTYIFVS